MKRGILSKGLAALVGGSLACAVGCPSDFDTSYGDYSTGGGSLVDRTLPPVSSSIYAQKVMAYGSNVFNPNNVLFKGDGVYSKFLGSENNPAQIVVAFARPFKEVNVVGKFTKMMYLQGYSGQMLYMAKPIQENGKIILKFYADPNRTEGGRIYNVDLNDVTNAFFELGETPERLFILEAYGECYIDHMYCKKWEHE